MYKLKRLLVFLLILPTILCGCSTSSIKTNSNKIKIICSIYPIYDWVKNITNGSENIEVTLLLKNGVDIHNFSPSADDIIKISDADLVVFTGSEADLWVLDTLKNADKFGFNCLENIENPILLNEHHNDKYDEHFWLSLSCAADISQKLAYHIIGIDTENQELYRSNTDTYIQKLLTLDSEYKEVISKSSQSEIVLPDKNPLKYLARDYSLTIHAAFDGCSTETDASFDTIISLSDKINDLNCKSVIVLKDSPANISESVIQNTSNKSIEILPFNSLQSVTDAQIKAGNDYIAIMQENLEILQKALS